MSRQRVAILYQALAPPTIGGLRKSPKPGGYSDSGADIAYTLKRGGHAIVTPVPDPDANIPLNWVFPDTKVGIQTALDKGANLLWANTVVFRGHPVEEVMGHTSIVGQIPAVVQDKDDKFDTNQLLLERGLPVAPSIIVDANILKDPHLTQDMLRKHAFEFPVIAKPIRGRGSQGVSKIASLEELLAEGRKLISEGEFGASMMIEKCLEGEEITITVMPPGSLDLSGAKSSKFWALRPVCRFNHENGIAPYNGTVAVIHNSRALSDDETAKPAMQKVLQSCEKAAEIVEARAPIRIDCRADDNGTFFLFDLNMKPNLTGAGRPGRDDQDSLCTIAAKADGWDYLGLLESTLAAGWKAE